MASQTPNVIHKRNSAKKSEEFNALTNMLEWSSGMKVQLFLHFVSLTRQQYSLPPLPYYHSCGPPPLVGHRRCGAGHLVSPVLPNCCCCGCPAFAALCSHYRSRFVGASYALQFILTGFPTSISEFHVFYSVNSRKLYSFLYMYSTTISI